MSSVRERMGRLVEGLVTERFKGYRPDIGYTKMVHSDRATVLLYFDERGKFLGAGNLEDDVFFKWIPDEKYRKHPDQVVDSRKFYAMAQDDKGRIFLKPGR